MKWLIIGGEGLLGSALIKQLIKIKERVIGTYFRTPILDECNTHKINITDSKINRLIIKEKPDVIINCAAITNVDYCETHQDEALKVNTIAVEKILRSAEKVNSSFVQISTVFVYKNGSNVSEESETNPLNFYAETKLRADKIVMNSKTKWLIIRPDQLFSWRPNTKGFVNYVINKLRRGVEFEVFDDFFNQPTYVPFLAETIVKLVLDGHTGVFNVTGSDYLNRYEWSLRIAEIMGFNKELIKPVKSHGLRAVRPNVSVSLNKIKKLGFKPLSINDSLMIIKRETSNLITKGVILAGGKGTRLYPATEVTNKHLLAVYNKPMIFYPLRTLINAGVTKILIISGGNNIGDFTNLLKSGKQFGIDITYKVQDEAGGIAQAIGLAEDFVGNDNFIVILGDNYYENDLKNNFMNFNGGARIILKPVSDPERFGVAFIDNGRIVNIIEKPVNPESNLAVTGCYVYDNTVFDIIKKLKPSSRGELEVTDVNNHYLKRGQLTYSINNGFWTDMGTPESLNKAATFISNKING